MSTADTDLKSTIGSIFRSASLAQARQFSGCDTLDVEEMGASYELGQVVARQTILIVISGADLTVLFKVHFNVSESDKLRRQKFRDQSNDEAIANAKTQDYMKELTNQMCGRICRVFQNNDLSLGMCIPLSMRGFYELYSEYTPNEGRIKKFGHAWRIKGEFGSLVCTAFVELVDSAAIANIRHIDDQVSNDDGELEFL